ncbi:MAG TPA: prepilin peptidase [Magnetospirillum sp.]|nr:prepilin peptidase [Magnetospirillum sp.]
MDPVLAQQWAIRLMFVIPLLVASYTDITKFRIPNLICLGMLACFPLAQWIAIVPAPWVLHVFTAAAVLGVGLMLFIPGLLGGGDAKLMAVCGLWLGPTAMLAALVLTTMTGGLLCLMLIILRALPLATDIAVLKRGGPIPYGLAIAAAGILLSHRLPMLGPDLA